MNIIYIHIHPVQPQVSDELKTFFLILFDKGDMEHYWTILSECSQNALIF